MAFFDTYLAIGHAGEQPLRPYLDVAEHALSGQTCQFAISSAEHQVISALRTLGRDDRLLVHRLVSVFADHARRHWMEGCPVALAQDLTPLSGTERVMVESLRHLPAEDLAAVHRAVTVLSDVARA